MLKKVKDWFKFPRVADYPNLMADRLEDQRKEIVDEQTKIAAGVGSMITVKKKPAKKAPAKKAPAKKEPAKKAPAKKAPAKKKAK